MFGKNIKRLRTQRGMTQAAVADLVGIHKRYYQDVEACRKIPSVLIAHRMRKALKCEWSEMTRGMK